MRRAQAPGPGALATLRTSTYGRVSSASLHRAVTSTHISPDRFEHQGVEVGAASCAARDEYGERTR